MPTRNYLPALKAELDGFQVYGTGANGLQDGVTHTYPWSELGSHLGNTGRQVWTRKVSDPHGASSLGGQSEEGNQRLQVDVRWPLNQGDILNQTDYEQLVEDKLHALVRNVENTFGGRGAIHAHVVDAQSRVEDAGRTVVRGLRVDVNVQRIQTYAVGTTELETEAGAKLTTEASELLLAQAQ